MTEKNWLVFDNYYDDIYWAESKEKAMDIAQGILDRYSQDEEGIPKEIMQGDIIVAKVVAKSYFEITERKSDYNDPDDWPYDDNIDLVGDLYMKEEDEEQ
jgi:hypothetical protein